MTSGRVVVAFLLAVLGAVAGFRPTAAKDMGSLYDDATLGYWQTRYERGIFRNLQVIIWPRLTPQERRRLATVRIEFPLRATGNDPYEFYSASPPPTVTISCKCSRT